MEHPYLINLIVYCTNGFVENVSSLSTGKLRIDGSPNKSMIRLPNMCFAYQPAEKQRGSKYSVRIYYSLWVQIL